MTVRNHRCRFAANNFVNNLSSTRATYSSQVSTFPFTNTQLDARGKVWKTSGYFLIESTNINIYINDGTDKTVALTASSTAYTTGALLAAHIQTRLNASSSGWTCTYSSTTYKFTIANSGSVSLRLSQTTNSAWDTIGFITSTDLAGTSFVADEQRNHTSEFAKWDLGSAASMNFFACIGVISSAFPISASATIKIQANNIDLWTAPPLDETITRQDGGILRFLDDLSDTSYRWWKFSFIDRLNPNGPQFALSHFYLGDYITFDERDINHGYEKTIVDPSIPSSSESGAMFFDTKTKFQSFSNLPMQIITRDDKDQLERLFHEVGRTTPFYFSVDPTLTYTDTLDELTRFVRFVDSPRFIHTMRDMFTTSISLQEVV